jgi:predicted phage-related endonuclease
MRAAKLPDSVDRRHFIGGSDARIIMGQDEKALIRLWQEKRGEVGPEDLSANLIVQLGVATEDLNRVWYERITTKMRFPVPHQRHALYSQTRKNTKLAERTGFNCTTRRHPVAAGELSVAE